MIRSQPPVYSPIGLASIARASFPSREGAGDACARLEAVLTSSYAAEGVVLCGSGTQALQVALRMATTTSPEAVVALPAFCCFDILSAAVGAGSRVSFYDLDPHTLSPDLGSLERAFQAGAEAAVVASLYGVPVPWDEVGDCARRYGAVLIEDAAQGHGASWRGRPLGSLATISVLSFGRGKGWTGGGGGAVLLRGAARAFHARLTPAPVSAGVRTRVAAVAQWALGRPALYGLPRLVPGLHLGETVYHPPTPPHAMPASGAELLLGTAAAAQREAIARRANARQMLAELQLLPGLSLISPPEDSDPGYLRLPVICSHARATLASRPDLRRLGIAASYPTELPLVQPAGLDLKLADQEFPGARHLVSSLFTIPSHSRVGRDREQIVRSLSILGAGAGRAAREGTLDPLPTAR